MVIPLEQEAAHVVHERATFLEPSAVPSRCPHLFGNTRAQEVLYVQADASRPGSLDTAVARGREKFGPIQAAVPSAIVLADRTIDRMDEATLLSALAPKVTGSVALFRAIRSEPLDFLLVFSSAESFSGDAGQSNYSAASTFKDAFASALAGVASYPGKKVNWGYRGEAGVVATDEYRAFATVPPRCGGNP